MVDAGQSTPVDEANFLRYLFNPTLAVIASAGANELCQESGLTFCELLKPFELVEENLAFKDPSNQLVQIANLRIDFRDLHSPGYLSDSCLRTALWNLMRAWKVPSNGGDRAESFSLPLESSQWFLACRNEIKRSLQPWSQEFLRSYLACLFVISTRDPDPWQCLDTLTKQQHAMQHQNDQLHDNVEERPKWYSPNILKFYILLHDRRSEDMSQRLGDLFELMKKTHGSHACHLLVINGGQATSYDGEQSVDHWSSAMGAALNTRSSCREEELFNDQTDVVVQSLETNFALMASDALGVGGYVHQGGETIEHPLSQVDLCAQDVASNACEEHSNKAPAKRRGRWLTEQDVLRVRGMISALCKQALLPYVERQLKFLNDIVSSRKGIGKSLLNATKKWLSGSSAPNLSSLAIGSSTGGSTEKSTTTSGQGEGVLPPESWEVQARRLADLAFLFHHYELSYQMHQMLRKEFSGQQMWLHYAVSCEMATVCAFILDNRFFPKHYMDAAVSTYADLCKRPWLAFRAALVGASMMSALCMWIDAAGQLVKVIDKDGLSGAVFLEEAARCFANVSMYRKAAFHLVLAGHRYSKVALRRHAVLCYARALRMYKTRHWNAAEAHVNAALGQLHHSLKENEASIEAFVRLFSEDCKPCTASAQQHSLFNEYLAALKQCAGQPARFNLPRLSRQDTVVYLNVSPEERGCYEGAEADNNAWRQMERCCSLAAGCACTSSPGAFRLTFQSLSRPPVAVITAPVNQPIAVLVLLSNPLNIAIGLVDVCLVCTLRLVDGQLGAVSLVKVDEFTLPAKGDKVQLSLEAIPHAQGALTLEGVAYGLCQVEPSAEQPAGYRLCKATAVYGSQELCSRALSVSVVSEVPVLDVDVGFASGKYFYGQIVSVPVSLRNAGSLAISRITVSAQPAGGVLLTGADSCSPAEAAMLSQSGFVSYSLLGDNCSPLSIGARTTATLWLRTVGASSPPSGASDSSTALRVLFHCTSSLGPGDTRQKCFRWKSTYTVAPSIALDMQCTRLPHTLHGGAAGGQWSADAHLAVVRVQNVSQVCRVKLHSIGVYSSASRRLESLLSQQREYEIEPDQWECLCLVVSTSRRTDALDTFLPLFLPADQSALTIPFANETWPPLKVSAEQTLLSVVWSTCIQCSDGTASMLYGHASMLCSTAFKQAGQLDLNPLYGLVAYDLHYKATVSHAFSKSRLCSIPVELHVHNLSSDQCALIKVSCFDRGGLADVVGSTPMARVHQVIWAGLTCTSTKLRAGQVATFNLQAVVSNAAVVDLKFGLRVEVEHSSSGQSYPLNLQSHFITVHDQ